MQFSQTSASVGSAPHAWEEGPRRVETVSGGQTVEPSTLKWLSQQGAPSYVEQPQQGSGGVDASELERLVRQQLEQDSHMAQAAQVLQNLQSQMGPFQEEFLQQTMCEIAKRCAAPESLSGEWGAAAVVAAANGSTPPATASIAASASTEQLGAWGCGSWGQLPMGGGSAVVSPPVGTCLPSGQEKSFETDSRIEELNLYIRQQSQEYLEGQAEWSRQVAEVRSECLRQVEKTRREKDQVEHQARQELLRLKSRLRDLGVKDEGATPADGAHGGDSPSNTKVGAWAAGVSLDEYNQVHAQWQAAEDRVRHLEEYIKEQSAKHLTKADSKEKDEEIAALRQVILAGGMELQQAQADLHALHVQYEQKIQFWEQGSRRLLGVAEQFLGQCNEQSGPEMRCQDQGHFANTATKVSLTLSKDKDGCSVGSLRRLLKDALTQSGPPDGKETAHKEKKKAARKAKEEAVDEPRPSSAAEEPALEEGKVDDRAPRIEVSAKSPCHSSTPSLSILGDRAALSNSNASSRETSPGSGVQVVDSNGVSCSDSPRGVGAAVPFISQLAAEMRRLLSASHQPGGSIAASPQASPSPCAASTGLKPVAADSAPGKLQEIMDSIAPARKGVATSIIMVEKMLRGLEMDLRKQCEDILGQVKLEVQIPALSSPDAEDAAFVLASTEEAKHCLPLAEEAQMRSMSSLRRAQQRTSALLAQFVQLPQKLKAVFDLTKRLGSEVNSLVPVSILQQAEARANRAHMVEQQQSFHVEVLQKRLQTLTAKVAELGGASEAEKEASEMDPSVAKRGIHEELQRGVSQEDQLVAALSDVHRISRELTTRGDRVKNLEKEVVDLHLSRYNERAQCLALLQQSAVL